MSQELPPASDNPIYSFLERQLGLLGDADPLEVLQQTPAKLAELVENIPEERWKPRPNPKTWSPQEVLEHLADMEWVFGFRIRHILCDSAPRLTGIDQTRWSSKQRQHQRSLGSALMAFGSLRAVNLDFWRSLSTPELVRSAPHEEAGTEMSLSLIRRIQAGHDLSHLKQIEQRLGIT